MSNETGAQTGRERFIRALNRQPVAGRVPHFELDFFLTMEAFGKVHPTHRNYFQWDQMTERERELHRRDIARLYLDVAERYGHDAIFIHPSPNATDEALRLLEILRELSGDRYYLTMHGDATFKIGGSNITEFSYRLADEPEKVKQEAAKRVDDALARAELFARQGCLDGFALCSDYCTNSGPYISPAMFSEFISPYLARLIEGYRKMGFYTIKHSDGNILPILDQLAQANPHALHSLDPQAGVDIAEVKRLYGGKLCLIGNVNCGLMQTGTDDEVHESARYALRHGMPGGGYIFSSSNCIYTGMDLRRYELMLEVLNAEGQY